MKQWTSKVPNFIKLMIPTIAVGGLLTIGFAWQQSQERQDRVRALCEMSVQHRDDDRALALYAIQNAPVPELNDVEYKQFAAYLDARLPPLSCEDGMVVPNDMGD